MLKKPRGVQVKQIVARIQQMNSMLPMFPGPDNEQFNENDLIDIILSMIPGQWRTQMVKMNFEPYESTMLDLQTTLEKIELIEKAEKLTISGKKHKNDTESKNSDHKEKSNKKNKKSDYKKGGRFCSL